MVFMPQVHERRVRGYLDTELLREFPGQGLIGSFIRPYLAAGKFPQTIERPAATALRDQDSAVSVTKYSCSNIEVIQDKTLCIELAVTLLEFLARSAGTGFVTADFATVANKGLYG